MSFRTNEYRDRVARIAEEALKAGDMTSHVIIGRAFHQMRALAERREQRFEVGERVRPANSDSSILGGTVVEVTDPIEGHVVVKWDDLDYEPGYQATPGQLLPEHGDEPKPAPVVEKLRSQMIPCMACGTMQARDGDCRCYV